MRRKMIEADLIDCVIGLGPNLFYNASMESCIVICRTQKPKARRGKILFINAVNEVTRERAQSFLTDSHLQRVVRAYQDFQDEAGFAKVASVDEVREKGGNLGLPLYLETMGTNGAVGNDSGSGRLEASLRTWLKSSMDVRVALETLTNKSSRAIK